MRRNKRWIIGCVAVISVVLGLNASPWRLLYPNQGLHRIFDDSVLSAMSRADFVNIDHYLPVEVDLRYATNQNFTGKILYQDSGAWLRRGTADKLRKACNMVSQDGYHIKIWDAYRPPTVQYALWNDFPNPRFVANPYRGTSNHSRGSALDLTLVDSENQDILMPSRFDEFGPEADRDYTDVSPAARNHAEYLQKVLVECGFRPLSSEWWHFEDTDVYPVAHTVFSAERTEAPAGYFLSQVFKVFGAKQALASTKVVGPKDTDNNRIEGMSEETVLAGGATILKISAIGDNTIGTDFRFPYQGSFAAYYDKYGPGHFFVRVEKIFQQDDLTIANLETTLTDSEGKANKAHQAAPFFFRGSSGYAFILRDAGIDVVNLANNHSWDYLENGYRDTISALSRAQVESFGNGRCSIVKRQGIKIALLGYNLLGPLEEGVNLAELKARVHDEIAAVKRECGLVIVSCHWGIENALEPTVLQRDFAHWAIDQGADLVLGHHPHVLQPIEEYKGKQIVYSLGNFSFGGNFRPGYRKTMIYQQEFVFVNGRLDGALPPKPLPCLVSTDPVHNNYQPTSLP